MTKEQSQLDKFKQAARDAECDTDEAKFDRTLKKVAKADPPSKTGKKSDEDKPGK